MMAVVDVAHYTDAGCPWCYSAEPVRIAPAVPKPTPQPSSAGVPESPTQPSEDPQRRLRLVGLQLLNPPLELGHHTGIAQSCDIPELPPLGDVAQKAAHDFAGARLR